MRLAIVAVSTLLASSPASAQCRSGWECRVGSIWRSCDLPAIAATVNANPGAYQCRAVTATATPTPVPSYPTPTPTLAPTRTPTPTPTAQVPGPTPTASVATLTPVPTYGPTIQFVYQMTGAEGYVPLWGSPGILITAGTESPILFGLTDVAGRTRRYMLIEVVR